MEPNIQKSSNVNNMRFNKIEMIPIMCNQLKGVIDKTEEAADELINDFLQINTKAKNQSNAVKSLFGSFSSEYNRDNTNVLVAIRKVLQNIDTNFTNILHVLTTSQEAAGEILKQTENVRSFVNRSEEITENSKVLAINATIEAARAGKHGHGFAVVAKEFKKLTHDTEKSTSEIKKIVESMETETNKVYLELVDGFRKGKQSGELVKESLNDAMRQITNTIESTKVELRYISEEAEILSNAVNSIVKSIQFQDITRQRIEHVIEPLMELYKELQSQLSCQEEQVKEHDIFWSNSYDWLLGKYTMVEEKEIANVYSQVQCIEEETCNVTKSTDSR